MGQQATCTLKFAGKTIEGTAWLEHKDLVFRGPERLAIPLKDITSAIAKDGRLRVTFGGKTADFAIGAAAPKWADRITNPPSRLDKLGIKAGSTILPLTFKDDAFVEEARARGAKIVRRAPAGGVDAIFFGASRNEDLARLADAVQSLQPNGALWVVRPKGAKAITEAETMAAGKRAGLVDVKVVSFSDTHTAEKFVIPVAKRATPSRVSPPPRKR
jgi:hypothetical protein